MENFGLFFRNERKVRSFTLDELAKKLNVAKGYLSSIENSKVRPPSTKVMLRISKFFGVSLEELMLRALPDRVPKEIRKTVTLLISKEIDGRRPKASASA